jgi:hypothetical protein
VDTAEKTFQFPARSVEEAPRREHPSTGGDELPIVRSAEAIDYQRPEPQPLTAALLNEAEEYPLMKFYMNQTSIKLGQPFTATVRIVNLTDRTILNVQPRHIQDLVHRLVFSGQNATPVRQNVREKDDQTLDRAKELCYAYAVAGFVEPRLVLRKEEIKDPTKEAWVGKVAYSDLNEFMRICEGSDELAARRLSLFSE